MRYKILSEPEKVFASMLRDIRSARKEIFLETYIYDDDKVGREFLSELVKKAEVGVKVRVLVDTWGSSVKKKFFRKLVEAGGSVRFFRELRYAWRWFNANHERNHRKLLIVDKKISYLGSINVTANGMSWRELVLRFEGDISLKFRKSFLDSWKRFNLAKSEKMRRFLHEEFEIIQDSPLFGHVPTERSYRRLVRKARSEILIETPYFVPSIGVRKALKRAVERGVVVKLLLPRRSDLSALDILRNRYLGKLYRDGVKIFYYDGVLHSKLLVIDDKFFLLGSSNLDYRSFRFQYEVNLLGKNVGLIRDLRKFFVRGLKSAKEFDYDVWQKRHWVSRVGEWFFGWIREYF